MREREREGDRMWGGRKKESISLSGKKQEMGVKWENYVRTDVLVPGILALSLVVEALHVLQVIFCIQVCLGE